jgi:gas vesicle protein
MTTVNDKIHQGAETAQSYAKDVASSAQDASNDVVDYLGKAARTVFGSIGIDAKTPLRMLERMGLERRRDSRMGEIGAFTVGVIVGGGAALIFAPMSGSKLRQRIREQVLQLIGSDDSKAVDAAAGAKELGHEVVQGAEKVVERVKTGLDAVAASAHQAVDKGNSIAQTIAERIDEQGTAKPVPTAKVDGATRKTPNNHS